MANKNKPSGGKPTAPGADPAAKAAAAAEAKAKVKAEAEAKAAAEAKAKEEAEGAKGKTKTIKVPALSVTSSVEGFRRGGRSWSKVGVVVKLSELNKVQIALIKDEGMLTVEEVEVDEEVAE